MTGHGSRVAGHLIVGALLLGAPCVLHAQDSTPPSPALTQAHERILADSTQRLSAQAPQRPTVRLTFTGDINLGTSFLPNGVPPDTQASAFARVDSLLRGDLVIGNFEGVLSDTLPAAKCGGKSNCYEFRTPHRMAPRLVDAGFTHLNLANNQVVDITALKDLQNIQSLDLSGNKVATVSWARFGKVAQVAAFAVAAAIVVVIGMVFFRADPPANGANPPPTTNVQSSPAAPVQ